MSEMMQVSVVNGKKVPSTQREEKPVSRDGGGGETQNQLPMLLVRCEVGGNTQAQTGTDSASQLSMLL